MPKTKIEIEVWKCNKCGHTWKSKNKKLKKPIVCPKCKNPRWDMEKK